MLKKIDVTLILKDHFNTLGDARNRQDKIRDIALFYGIPMLVACAVFIFPLRLSDQFATGVISAAAIFGGLLLNLLVLMYSLIDRLKSNKPDQCELIRQLHANISYSIFVSIVLVCLCLAKFIPSELSQGPGVFADIVDASVLYALCNFILTIPLLSKLAASRAVGR